MADFKLRLKINEKDIFYYPDVMIACQREGVETYYLRYPKLLVEVLSPSTQEIDRREKLLNYKEIPSVEEYAIVSQSVPELTLHHREERWAPQRFSGREAVAEFRSIRLHVPLAQIYEGDPM